MDEKRKVTLTEAEANALRRDMAKLNAMPCNTIEEAMAVSGKMQYMLARYGQYACTGLERPEDSGGT